MEKLKSKLSWKIDFSSSIVVFFIALPLCLGIAVASGAPAISGIIAGIIGGIIVGIVSGSQVSVSGPAAGLIIVVISGIKEIGSYEGFLVSVSLAGLIQIFFGLLRFGKLGELIPSSVIKGMLASIGILLILKQIPHAIGYDESFFGNESFEDTDGHNTFSELFFMFQKLNFGIIIISVISLFMILMVDKTSLKKIKILEFLPISFIAVVVAVMISEFYQSFDIVIESKHLITIPKIQNFNFFFLPKLKFLMNPIVWMTSLKIAVVASVETLLNIEAADKLDPQKRITPTNRELIAQGIGNSFSGLLGGLPITSVIVRTSVNIQSGNKSKLSTIFHGIILLISILLLIDLLNKIPLSVLAVILILSGYKLTKPSLFKKSFQQGKDQFVPFMVTVIAILLTDLLIGISIGLVAGVFFVIKSNYQKSIFIVQDENNYLIKLKGNVTFVNKLLLREKFSSIPEESFILIDGTLASHIDFDIMETIEEFLEYAKDHNIYVELKKSKSSMNLYFRKKDGDL